MSSFRAPPTPSRHSSGFKRGRPSAEDDRDDLEPSRKEKWISKKIGEGIDVLVDSNWAKQPETTGHRDICTLCNSGGELVHCDIISCTKSICKVHLQEARLRELTNDSFTCPHCHMKNNPNSPYTAFSSRGSNFFDIDAARMNHPFGKTDPGTHNILILTVYLDDDRTEGVDEGVGFAPTKDLANFLPGQVAHVGVPYSFKSQEDVQSFHSKMNALASALDRGVLKRITRVCVILFSSTDRSTGLLHTQKNDGRSDSLKNALGMLFPKNLRASLKRLGPKSNFILYNSGIFWQKELLRKEVVALLDELKFNHILGFTEIDWHWALSMPFLTFAIRSYFIEGLPVSDIAERMVGEAYGSHSGVAYAEHDTGCIKEVFFHHPTQRPFGIRIDPQCKTCGWLDAWTRPYYQLMSEDGSKEVESIVLRCRNPGCENELKMKKPAGRFRSRRGEGLTDYKLDEGTVMVEQIYTMEANSNKMEN